MPRLILKTLMTVCTVSFGLTALAPMASAFNPQPEPPEVGRGIQSKLDRKAFNPQPEPPEVTNGLKKKRVPKIRFKFRRSR
jgi:hypothetical protein